MSAEAHAVHATVTGIDNRKFGMWVLIGSECFLFGALILNYLVNRDRGLVGPKATDIFNIDITTLSTFDLLMSSVAMVLALHACQMRESGKFRFWTAMVAVGGLIFLGFQYFLKFILLLLHEKLFFLQFLDLKLVCYKYANQ